HSDPNENAKFAATSLNRSDLAKLLEKFREGLFLYQQFSDEARKERNLRNVTTYLKGHSKKQHNVLKRIPVLFIDEAHKLRNLIHDDEALHLLFDAMAVFTAQDKLCQIVHSTSDGLYERLLAQGMEGAIITRAFAIFPNITKTKFFGIVYSNKRTFVIPYTKNLIIGDLKRSEISHAFRKDLLPSVPKEIYENLAKMEDDIYEILGGRIVDWQNFVRDYKVSDGNLTSRD
ncbi:4836_t:CDS:2, partial [Acaulospora morrowiae]